jgi:hypothetical protein
MIYDSATRTIFGNLGWVDKGALWKFDLDSQAESLTAVEGAGFLSLRPGLNGLFRLVHHQSGNQAISIRSSSGPAIELASVTYESGRSRFSGDLNLWQFVDPAAIIQTKSWPRLVLIDAPRQRVIDLDLAWFNEESYDLGYQGLTDCISVQNTKQIIVSIQRSSKLIIVDSERNAQVGSIVLADRGGNPDLRRLSNGDIVASDYDTLCRVDGRSLVLDTAVRLQDADATHRRQFIGDFDPRADICAVARPFSGDAVLVDTRSFKVLSRASVVGQPLSICMVSESRFVTRDWRTGRVQIGEFVR